jgi:flagellar hook-associated protein 3 FlgL
MTRVATVPLQHTLSGAIQRSQGKLAAAQIQLNTQTKTPDYASLGTQAVRNLSAHSLVAREEAHSAVATQLGTTLSLYDANISGLDTMGGNLSQSIFEAVATGDSPGLQEAIGAAFDQFRATLNASQGGVPLFGGSQTTPPFTPSTLADTAGLDPASAFTNDGVKASARVGDHLDVTYGVTASDLGTDMLAAFRTLAEAGPIGARPTPAQTESLKKALGQIGTALGNVRAINGENGRKQAQLETLATRADQRGLIYKGIISRNEDADLGQVAIDIAQQKAVLEASYSVFGQLSGLSLVNYLR